MARPLRAGALGPIDRVQFTPPLRQLTLMVISLALVSAGVSFAYPRVSGIFLANVWLNGFIALVFVIGVFATIWQTSQLFSSVRWIGGFVAGTPGHQITIAPRLLAPLASLLRSHGTGGHISATSARSILESVGTRIEEERDITRYLVNLLIFLGLLGTFYGLATSVPAVVETIRSLAPQEGESALNGFGQLMTGLEAQMGGMGTAFSSSLLGLAGSLVVGILELFASQAQNRFYRQLEEWLSSITRLGTAQSDGEGGEGLGMIAEVLDSLAEQMEGMRELQTQAEAGRAQLDGALETLAGAVSRLADRGQSDGATGRALQQLAEGQERLIALIERQGVSEDEPHIEAETRMRLRSMDVQLVRILEELSAGRQEAMADLRGDLASLTQAVRMLNRQQPPNVGYEDNY
ncbi:biopolymer transporter ExbB [Pararhodobacter zhoushanensis]|uniref:Biopolymer transporter ExbB n=1 Tax=Pararhodobacter zhoushanensis TaxID=2479545 RepID=A0ABT3H2V5_9RHOB|nr:biopolymer transporter ExbB [Pararhodobacter zhoushanensis]MCW1934166.1 biopolymer transporter ExbB [Pararhodobacter zhoushanensis]